MHSPHIKHLVYGGGSDLAFMTLPCKKAQVLLSIMSPEERKQLSGRDGGEPRAENMMSERVSLEYSACG